MKKKNANPANKHKKPQNNTKLGVRIMAIVLALLMVVTAVVFIAVSTIYS